ncbi:MAG: dihydrolipoamide dehydrogenase [Actinomycetota bacterium]|jgi:dihydrolipoamide dehydrogenase|nr:dihydrolipoamide dehydrogenase [Actinomycetota bacterium]
MADAYDIVVIGGGPGGYAAALYAAAAGLTVAVVEKDKVGGTCLHRGCIPAKQFLETASVFRTVAGAKEFGIQAEQPTVDFAVSQARKQKVVTQLWKGLQTLMKSRKITTVTGTGALGPGRTVRVTAADGSADTELVGRHVILASGSVPRTLPGFDVDGQFVLTSDEVLALDRLPGSAVVIGGGAIGCEFASMMSDLGTQVTVLEALPRLLAGCDVDVADVIARSFKRRGIDIHAGIPVHGHQPGDGQTTVSFGDGKSVTVDVVVVSVGRRPLSDGLLLDGTAVELDPRGFVAVDELMRTGEDGVYAVGDLVNTPQLAHVGFAEAIVAVQHILGEDPLPVDYGNVPWAIYCHPEVAFAGVSEQAARDAGRDIVVSKHRFASSSRAMIIGETEGLVKVIAEKAPDGRAGKLLGVHMAGPWVTEQLAEGWLAVNWEATPDDLAPFIHPHPTLSETFGEAVLTLTGRGLHG